METPRATSMKKPMRSLRILLAALALFLGSAPFQIPGMRSDLHRAAALAQPLPGKLQESYGEKLSKEQQQEIIEKNTRVRKLQEGIIDHKIKILGSKTQERSLLGELETIEQKLRTQKEMLDSLQAESERQELLLADKREYLRQILAEKKQHQIHVKNRLAGYYRMGSVGLMNVLFSSESLPELLDFKEYFGIMVQRDHAIIQQYLGEIGESNRAREDHAREKLRLLKLTDAMRENEIQLQQKREEKNLLLKQVNTEQHLYEQAVREIEEAAADLAATLRRLQTVAARPSPPPSEVKSPLPEGQEKAPDPEAEEAQQGFPARKGLLDPPVYGIVITFFGQKVKGKFDSSPTANGIDIKVAKGMEIKAVYDGKIIHSGYLRGYGNLMIIDHGRQYFSLVSRAADFYKKEGAKVAQGEVIGMTGDGDPLYGEGLHFEIRKGSNPEDPLLWLKKDVLPREGTTAAEQ